MILIFDSHAHLDDEKFNEEDNPIDIFCEFYQEMNGQPISQDEKKIMTDILKEFNF